RPLPAHRDGHHRVRDLHQPASAAAVPRELHAVLRARLDPGRRPVDAVPAAARPAQAAADRPDRVLGRGAVGSGDFAGRCRAWTCWRPAPRGAGRSAAIPRVTMPGWRARWPTRTILTGTGT